MRWGDFKRTIVWSGVTFERTFVWSEVILSAQSSGRWSGFGMGHGRTVVWTMVWFWSDQRSFPSGKIWSESVSSAFRAHTVFRAHFSLIRGYFGLGWSDQRLLSSGTVWSEATSTWEGHWHYFSTKKFIVCLLLALMYIKPLPFSVWVSVPEQKIQRNDSFL